jgi:hypothetical protein
MTDGHLVSLSWNKAHIWGLRPEFYSCQAVAGFLMWSALWREDRSVVYNCCWSSPVQSFWGPSPAGLMNTFYCLESNHMLLPKVGRPVCLGIKHPSGPYDQIFITVRQLRVCWCRVLSDEWTGLTFIIAAGPSQRSHSRVRFPWDSWPYFTVSDSRLPFSSPPTTRGATVKVFYVYIPCILSW